MADSLSKKVEIKIRVTPQVQVYLEDITDIIFEKCGVRVSSADIASFITELDVIKARVSDAVLIELNNEGQKIGGFRKEYEKRSRQKFSSEVFEKELCEAIGQKELHEWQKEYIRMGKKEKEYEPGIN